jgi:hypothetical protein
MCVLFGCSAQPVKPNSPRTPPSRAAMSRSAVVHRAPIDVIVELEKPLSLTATLEPGAAQLQIGGESLDAPEGTAPIEVDVLEERGNDVRVGVRLMTASFAIWTSRARLLVELRGDVVIDEGVTLHAGARVHRLAHEGQRTKVRYVGAVEVEGWVPDKLLVDRGAPHRTQVGPPAARKKLMVHPGAVIHSQPQWAAQQRAVVSHSYFIDEVEELDAPWRDVVYEDSDVSVRGFLSTQEPPGRTHRRPEPEPMAPTPTNATLPDHTCLYSGGEQVGFLTGAQQVAVTSGPQVGWLTITLDTPWGPIDFAGKGATESTLETCGI